MIETLALLVVKSIDNQKAVVLKNNLQNKIYQQEGNIVVYTKNINELEDELRKNQSAHRVYEQNKKMIERFEHLTQLIDFKLPTEHPDAKL